jgi:hypothetical protein
LIEFLKKLRLIPARRADTVPCQQRRRVAAVYRDGVTRRIDQRFRFRFYTMFHLKHIHVLDETLLRSMFSDHRSENPSHAIFYALTGY